MQFSYGYAQQNINNRKNAADLLAILMAMRISQYRAEHIAQYGRSRELRLNVKHHDWS